MIEDELHLVGANRTELEEAVAAHPFLSGLNAHYIRLIADCAMRCHFTAGQVIFRKGDTANRFYLIERGKVALESSAGDQVVRIDEVGGGDLLGWSWIFPPWGEQDLTKLRDYCEADPVLGYLLFKRMSEVMMRRLQAARVKLSEALRNASH